MSFGKYKHLYNLKTLCIGKLKSYITVSFSYYRRVKNLVIKNKNNRGYVIIK